MPLAPLENTLIFFVSAHRSIEHTHVNHTFIYNISPQVMGTYIPAVVLDDSSCIATVGTSPLDKADLDCQCVLLVSDGHKASMIVHMATWVNEQIG